MDLANRPKGENKIRDDNLTARILTQNVIISNAIEKALALIASFTPRAQASLFGRINKVSPRYIKIMKLHNEGVDVSTNSEFQTSFNGFYQVRRNSQWRNKFYKFFQKLRLENKSRLTLKNILRHLYSFYHKWEYSFSTKMLHTLDDNQPIVDSKILRLLDIPIPGQRGLQKLLEHYVMYNKIILTLFKKTEVKEVINEFDENCPQLKRISRVKKLDFILWQFKNAQSIHF